MKQNFKKKQRSGTQKNTAATAQAAISADNGKWLTALKIVAAAYVLVSCYQLFNLAAGQRWYYDVFDYLPKETLDLRYAFSFFWSLLCVAAGIGLFFLKKPARIAVMVISGLTMAAAYWRHPYAALLKHTRELDLRFPTMFAGNDALVGFSFAKLTGVVIFLQITTDVLLCSALIYFLTRPKVKCFFSS